MRRKPMSRKGSKSLFRKTSGTHYKNIAPRPQRGGIRL